MSKSNFRIYFCPKYFRLCFNCVTNLPQIFFFCKANVTLVSFQLAIFWMNLHLVPIGSILNLQCYYPPGIDRRSLSISKMKNYSTELTSCTGNAILTVPRRENAPSERFRAIGICYSNVFCLWMSGLGQFPTCSSGPNEALVMGWRKTQFSFVMSAQK